MDRIVYQTLFIQKLFILAQANSCFSSSGKLENTQFIDKVGNFC